MFGVSRCLPVMNKPWTRRTPCVTSRFQALLPGGTLCETSRARPAFIAPKARASLRGPFGGAESREGRRKRGFGPYACAGCVRATDPARIWLLARLRRVQALAQRRLGRLPAHLGDGLDGARGTYGRLRRVLLKGDDRTGRGGAGARVVLQSGGLWKRPPLRACAA